VRHRQPACARIRRDACREADVHGEGHARDADVTGDECGIRRKARSGG
jgi:hypothetical protein